MLPITVKKRDRDLDRRRRGGSAEPSVAFAHRSSPSRGAFRLSAAIVLSLSFFLPASVARAGAPAPTVSDNTWAGQTLQATKGADADTLQWFVCTAGENQQNTGCTAAGSGTIQTNLIVGDHYYVTESDGQSSLGTQTVTAQPPVAANPPSVSGSELDGRTLTLTDGTWANESAQPPDALHVVWSSCPPGESGNACPTSSVRVAPGAGSTYALGDSDVGNTVSVTETPIYGGNPGTAQTWTAGSAVVPALTGAGPQISGSPQAGSTLSLTQGIWDDDVAGIALTDQWEDCSASSGCSPIENATGTSYTVQRSDAGDTIEVVETATQNGASSSAPSNQTAVATAVPVNTAPPEVQGTPQFGQPVSATTGSWTESPDGFTYQWLTCTADGTSCTTIATAQSASYTPVDADVGGTLEVQVTASVQGTPSTPATSAPSAQVVPGPSIAPTISGTPSDGNTLTLHQGTWDGGAATVTQDQWLRCDSSGGCTAMTPTTPTTYMVTRADAGDTFEVTETASENGASASTTTTPTAAATAVPVAQSAPTISGTAQTGQTLTATTGAWTEQPTGYAYQWSRCAATCAAITGATSSSYTAVDADVGDTLEVTVTASVYATAGQPLTSAATAQVLPGVTTAPAISGTPAVGSTLTVQQGTWDGGAATVSQDQWEDCVSASSCTPIAGATGTTYTATRADAGDMLQVVETATENGVSASTATAPTAVVTANPIPVAQSAPTISGTAQSGQTLTATTGTWTNRPTAYAYQWSRCAATCAPITGATSSTYTATDADVGDTLEVTVTASVQTTAGQPLTSEPTAVIAAAPAATTPAQPAPATSATPVSHAVAVALTVASTSGVNGPTVLRVTVTGTAAPVRGTVTVRSSTATLAGCGSVAVASSTASASATCTTHLAGGVSDLTASFTPAAGVTLTAGASAARTVTITPAATRTAVAVPPRPLVGDRITYTASVTPPAGRGAPLHPAGTVRFTDGDQVIAGCSAVLLSAGQATCTTRYSGAGAHRISAAYVGDGSFGASRSAPQRVTVRFPSPVGAITATMSWTFHYTRRYTEIRALSLRGAAAGSSVTISCSGRGCPFESASRSVRSGGTVDLDGRLQGRRLAPGTTVEIAVRRLRYTGKHYTFRFRAGHPPVVRISCLAQGSDTPGVGCTGG
jgi:hypothetical protein